MIYKSALINKKTYKQKSYTNHPNIKLTNKKATQTTRTYIYLMSKLMVIVNQAKTRRLQFFSPRPVEYILSYIDCLQ